MSPGPHCITTCSTDVACASGGINSLMHQRCQILHVWTFRKTLTRSFMWSAEKPDILYVRCELTYVEVSICGLLLLPGVNKAAVSQSSQDLKLYSPWRRLSRPLLPPKCAVRLPWIYAQSVHWCLFVETEDVRESHWCPQNVTSCQSQYQTSTCYSFKWL